MAPNTLHQSYLVRDRIANLMTRSSSRMPHVVPRADAFAVFVLAYRGSRS